VLRVSRFLAMVKDTKGFLSITMGEVFLRLISCSIVLQFRGSFQEHLFPHQFGILTLRGYETILFGI
jgi:glucuronate isomerase